MWVRRSATRQQRNNKARTMPTSALYCLIGSCLVLNAVYSLPIDDDAVSFSLPSARHVDSLCVWLKMCVFIRSRNESNNSMEKELRDWINWTAISDFLLSTRCHFSRFSAFAIHSFLMLLFSQLIALRYERKKCSCDFFSCTEGVDTPIEML